MARQRYDEPTSRPPLGLSQRDFLFAYLLRDPALFARAALQITDECFAEDERALRLLWRVAKDYRQEHNELPDRELLATQISNEADLDQESITNDDIEEINQLLELSFNLDHKPSYPRVAAKWLQYFLEDRLMQEVRRNLSLPHTPDSVREMFTSLADRAATIRSVSEGGLDSPFPEGWDDDESAVVETTPTGLSFLDTFMGGGDARGEVYGLLAPFGGGKTTISVQITIEKAKRAHADWVANGRSGVCGRAYHFAYEDTMSEIRLRALCYLSKIPLTRLTDIISRKAYNEFSTEGHYRDYERDRFRDALAMGDRPAGERQRFEVAIDVMTHCWRGVYMGATPEHPKRGTGLVDEVASLIEQDLSQNPFVRPDVVLTDYVLAASRRHLDEKQRGYDQLRHYIVGWPSQLRHKVAMPFNCPAWAMQQLSGKANQLRPGHLMSSLDSGEGKGFPENCNFCFAVGKMNSEQYATFSCDKHRRQGISESIVVHIDGANAEVKDVRTRFTIDPQTHSILSRSDASRLGPSREGGRRLLRPNGRGPGNVVNQHSDLGLPTTT